MPGKTRARSQIRIPDDWDGVNYKTVMLCVPDSELWCAAFTGAVSTLARGRYWDAETGSVLDAIATGDAIFESLQMNCNDVFDGISATLKDISLSAGCCPADVTDEPPVNPPANETEFVYDGAIPPGFGSWEDVNDQVCQLAQKYHADMVKVITEVENYGSLGTSVGGIALTAVTALISLPWTIAVGSVAAVVFLLTDFSLRVARQEFEQLQFEWVCAIRSADTVTVAKANVDKVLEDNMSNAAAIALLQSWVTINWLNKIWEGNHTPSELAQYDPGVCDPCPPPGACELVHKVRFGDSEQNSTGDLTPNGASRVLTSQLAQNGFHYIEFEATQFCSCANANYDFNVTAISLIGNEGAGYSVWEKRPDCTLNLLITSGGIQTALPLGLYTGTAFSHVGDVPFTITLSISTI